MAVEFSLPVIYRLSNEEREKSEKTKQASSVVNLILPEVRLLDFHAKKKNKIKN